MLAGLAKTAGVEALPIAMGAVTGLATLCGGLIALALRKHLHLLLGFSAGAILGVSLLELLPEAARVGGAHPSDLGLFAGVGYGACLLIDRAATSTGREASLVGARLGPASLTIHSLLDGLAIGVAFQASGPLGLAVAAAVIAHDLSDGANTVNLGLLGGDSDFAFRWLVADAAAPIIGVVLARAVSIPTVALSPLLAIVAGSFLYIGAGKLMAESYRRHPHFWTSLMSILGFCAVYVIVRWDVA